jgi:hypothetical protein
MRDIAAPAEHRHSCLCAQRSCTPLSEKKCVRVNYAGTAGFKPAGRTGRRPVFRFTEARSGASGSADHCEFGSQTRSNMPTHTFE